MAIVKPLKYISVNTALVIESTQKQLTGYAYGTYGAWTTTANPTANKTTYKVKYSSKNTTTSGTPSSLSAQLTQNVTINGTTIKYRNTRTVGDVTMTDVPCKYRTKSKIVYGSKYKSGGTYYQNKTVYKNYYVQRYYRDKPVYTDVLKTEVQDDQTTAFFDSYYYDMSTTPWTRVDRSNPFLPHPTTFNLSYEDLDANLSGVQDYNGRNTSGTYVKQNLRSNIRTIEMEWQGISQEDARQLVPVLSPSHSAYKKGLLKKGDQFVNIQFYDAYLGAYTTKVFFASARTFEVLPNGYYGKIAVTFTEV